MSVPNISLLKRSLENLAKELQNIKRLIGPVTEEWDNGYRSGQWDAGFHIENLLSEFFDTKNPKELS